MNDRRKTKAELISELETLRQRLADCEKRSAPAGSYYAQPDASLEFEPQRILDSIPVILWTGRPDGYIDYCNEGWLAFTGMQRHQVMGDGWMAALHPDDTAHTAALWAEACARGSHYEVEQRLKSKDGEYHWFLTRANPVKDDAGNIIKWYGSNTDITALKQAQETVQLNSEILAHMAEGVMLARMTDNVIVYANPRFEKMFGYAPGDLLGRHVGVLNAPGEMSPRAIAETIQTALQSAGYWRGKLCNVRRDGSTFWCHINISTFVHPQYGQVLLSVQSDITDQERAQEELLRAKQAAEASEQEISALYARLNTAQKIAHIGSWDWDMQTNTVWWSDETYEIFGVTRADYIPDAERNAQFYHPDDLEMFAQLVQNAIENGAPLDCELRLVLKNGVEKITHAQGQVLCDANDKPAHFSGTIMDITERKKQEQALHEIERNEQILFDTMAAGVALNEIIYDENHEMIDYRILKVNRGFYATADFGGINVEGMLATQLYGMSADFIKTFWQQHRKRSDTVYTEMKSPRADTYFFIATSPIVDDKFVTSFVDITARKRAEEALQKSEEKYRLLVETADDVILQTDINGKQLFRNSAYYTSLGFEVGAEVDADGYARVHPDDAPLMKQVLEELGKHGKAVNEYRVRHRDGHWVYRQAKTIAIYNAQHQPESYLSIIRDITERKRAEEALRTSEEFLKDSEKIANMGSWELDLVLNKVYWSDNCYALYGFKPGEITPSFEFFKSRVHPQDLHIIDDTFEAVMQTQQSYSNECRITLSDGTIRWIQNEVVSLRANGRVVKLRGIQIDITERKRAQETLEMNSLILRNISEGVNVVRLEDGSIVYANPTLEEMFGYEPGELLGKPVSILNAPEQDNPDETAERIAQALQKNGVWSGEMQNITKQGKVFWCLANVSMFTHPQFGPVGVSVHQDITERKRAAEALRESQRRYRLIFDNSGTANSIFDTDCRLIIQNSMSAQASGTKPGEALGKSATEIFGPARGPIVTERMQRVLASGVSETYETDFDLPSGRKWFRSVYQPIFDEQEKMYGIQVISQDITESKQAEESLQIKDWAIRSSINAVALSDLEGKLIYVNPAFLTLWRYRTEQEILGRPANEFWQAKENADKVISALHTQGGWVGEMSAKCKDGTLLDIDVSASMVTDNAGKPLCLMGAFVDITERKRAAEALRESEASLRESERVAHVGHWVWHTQTNRVEWSDEMTRIFGVVPNAPDLDLDRVIQERIHPADRDRVRELNAAVITDAAPAPLEYRVILPDGSTRIIYAIPGNAIKDENGSIVKLTGIVQDITERKLAEQEIAKRDALFRAIVEHNHDGILLMDRQHQVSYISPSYARMTGYTTQERAAINEPGFVHPDDFANVADTFARVLETPNTPVTAEYRIRHKEGHWLWVEATATNLLGEPHIAAVMLTSHDITARKRAENELRESEARYRLLFENTSALVSIYDADGVITMINETNAAVMGGTPKDFIGKSLHAIFPDQADLHLKRFKKIIQDKQGGTFDDTFALPDGERWYTSNLQPLLDANGNAHGVQIVAFDITERKRAENELRESEHRFRETLENVHLVAVGMDTQAKVTFCNDYLLEITGWTRDQVLGQDWFEKFLPPAIQQAVRVIFLASMETGDLPRHFENAVLTRTGELRLISWNNTILRDPQGNITGTISLGADITERKKAEEALRASETQLRTILQTARDGFLLMDAQGNFLQVNDAYCAMTGFTQAELLTMRIADIESQESPDQVKHTSNKLRAPGTTFLKHATTAKMAARLMSKSVRPRYRTKTTNSSSRLFATLPNASARRRYSPKTKVNIAASSKIFPTPFIFSRTNAAAFTIRPPSKKFWVIPWSTSMRIPGYGSSLFIPKTLKW